MDSNRCVEIPDSLDDITAAAIANPGMAAWAGLVVRGALKAGQTVMINGATGTAGRLTAQLAKHLGAGTVMATGRNAEELEELKKLGADVVVPFALPEGGDGFEKRLKGIFANGIDLVIDYLWGESARRIVVALAQTVAEKPVRFVQIGSAAGEPTLALSGTVLREAAIELVGSGLGSVSTERLLQGISDVFERVQAAGLKIATQVHPLSEVAEVWARASGRPRVVFAIQ